MQYITVQFKFLLSNYH